MKKARIINACVWIIITLAVCIYASIGWRHLGCEWFNILLSLLALILPLAGWAITVDDYIKNLYR